MQFSVCESDFQLLTSVLTLLNKKGGRNPSITRKEMIIESGVSDSLFTRKIKNSYIYEQQLKERIP